MRSKTLTNKKRAHMAVQPLKQFRIELWNALREDDADALMHCIQQYSEATEQSVPAFLSNTVNTMWRPGNHTQKGLLEACCCNIRGIDVQGCQNCAQAVIDLINLDIDHGNHDHLATWAAWKKWTRRRWENLENVEHERYMAREWVIPLLDTIPLDVH